MLLCSAVLHLGGRKRLGVFRQAADVDEVRRAAAALDSGGLAMARYVLFGDEAMLRQMPDKKNTWRNIAAVSDVLVVCDLLKLLLRRMPEPIIPYTLYNRCIEVGNSRDKAVVQVNSSCAHITKNKYTICSYRVTSCHSEHY